MAQVGAAAGRPGGPGRSDLEERGVHVNILKGHVRNPETWEAEVLVLVLPLISSLYLSEPQFLHLENGIMIIHDKTKSQGLGEIT